MATSFFPRGGILEILVMEAEGGATLFQGRARVMRIQMTDRRPAYLVGTAFTDLDDAQCAAVETLLDRLEGMQS